MNARTKVGRAMGAAVVAVALAVALPACGAGQVAQTAEQETATGGAGGEVGQMAVRNAKIAFDRPISGDAVYLPGQDAPLVVSIVNTGAVADRLVAVRSPIAASTRIVGNTVVAGGHEVVAGYHDPVAAITLPGETEVEITLVGLTVPIRSGLTYPVAFVFERAGALAMALPVEIPSDILPPRAREDEPEVDRVLQAGPEAPPVLPR